MKMPLGLLTHRWIVLEEPFLDEGILLLAILVVSAWHLLR